MILERVMIVGPGALGLSLGDALWQADAVRSLLYCGRRPEPPSHPLFGQGIAEYHFGLASPPPGTEAVVLAVPDGVLAELAHALAGQGRPAPDTVALHTSGSSSAEVLGPLHAAGYSVGTFFPLRAISHPLTGADRLHGAAIAVSGEPPAQRVGHALVRALRGRLLEVPVQRRAVLHAASILMSNGAAALMAVGVDLLARAGVAGDGARVVLADLARDGLDDVSETGDPGVVPGPVSAGDHESLGLHLRALEGADRDVYRALSQVLLDRAPGVAPDVGDALRFLLRTPATGDLEEAL